MLVKVTYQLHNMPVIMMREETRTIRSPLAMKMKCRMPMGRGKTWDGLTDWRLTCVSNDGHRQRTLVYHYWKCRHHLDDSKQKRLRRRYTIRFARTEPADCPVHGSIVTCDMSLECPGHLKIGWKGFTARSIFEPILPPELCDYPIRAQQTPKTTFTLYDCERETSGVSQCT